MSAVVVPLPGLPERLTSAATAPEPGGEAKRKAEALAVVMRYVRALRGELGTDSLSPAMAKFERQFAGGALPGAVRAALAVLQPEQCPDRATLYRWDKKYTAYLAQGPAAAAPKHRGRQRTEWGWEVRAMALYHIPSKPTWAGTADQLRREGWDTATDSRVRAYLKSLPATLGPQSPAREGRHYHRQNLGPYRMRNTDCLAVGEVYSMDGHTVDVYLAHPVSGGIFRPELTLVLDIASRFIAGWYLSEAESTYSAILALSHAFTSHDHVCAWLHVDNGSGFKNKAMNTESVGYYDRFGIQTMYSIPGNSKGRGHVERVFRTLRDGHDKFFANGEFYCGDDMAPEINRRLSDQVRRGKRRLPTLAQYRDSVAAWVEHYNQSLHSALDGRTPAQLWATLERLPVGAHDATVRERVLRKVVRGTVTVQQRVYRHPDLALYQDGKQQLACEYSIHDDAHLWVYDAQDRLICIAELASKPDYIERSRLEDQRKRAKRASDKRLENRRRENQARHTPVIDHDQQLASIARLTGAPVAPAVPEVPAAPAGGLDLMAEILNRPDPDPKKKGASLRLTPFDLDE